MALKRVKGSIDRIFDKSLQDLVRGIRNHKDNEAHYVSLCVDEIKVELKQENIAVKANAVNKLIYLQMLGYDISWAAFNIIEVMSSPKFTYKRIGYLAASQCFHADTDVLMLTTNMIRKDLGSQQFFDAGIALNGLSCFITPDLARDLANDIFALMTSIRPYTRKRAVLISYKIFLCYPDALRPAFPRLKEKLEDPDPGVQSAAVNVICELARKNPKNYLSLAPVFFKLMTTSTNNWVLIKIIKLFGALTPLEPRLGKKLIEPLTNLIHNTSAMSLLYECINTVVQGMQDHGSSIQLCVQKLRILIEDSDQNLKYLGLLAMSRILKTHPKAVQAHKDLILRCLDDKDESIRLRALDLLFGMVSKKNLMEIVQKLMVHVAKADGSQYRDELINKIIEICCQNNFQYITNFEWYISVLIELTRIDGTSSHGGLISSQILDVAIRVKSIRQFAARQMATMLENAHALMGQLHRNGMEEVLFAAAYICGEFSQFLDSPDCLIHAMMRPRATTLPGHIQGVYLHNIMKIYAVALKQAEGEEDNEKAIALTQALQEKLPIFVQSSNLEVQERASCILSMLKYVEKIQSKEGTVAEEFSSLFKGELNPVAPKAQRKVPIPEGLDLDAWINDPPSSSEEEEEMVEKKMEYEQSYDQFYSPTSEKRREMSPEEISKKREQRIAEQANNPNYLMSKKAEGYMNPDDEDEAGSINLDISVPLHVPGMPSSDRYLKMEQNRRMREKAERVVKKKKEKKRGKHGKKANEIVEEDEEDIVPVHTVEIISEEMPDGAVKTDSEDDQKSYDPHKALDIDLDSPLAASEVLPKPKHRETLKTTTSPTEPSKVEKPKKRKHKKKEKKHKKKHSKHPAASLLVEEEEDGVNGDEKLANGVQQEGGDSPAAAGGKADDLSFWLSNPEETAPSPVVNGVANEEEKIEENPTKEKKKKHKKKKESKKSKQKQSEAEIPPPPPTPQMSRYKLLGENDDIRIDFETRCIPRQEKKITVSVIFSNLSSNFIKNIEFNVLDTLNTRLIRDEKSSQHDAVSVPFSLPPSARNECQLDFSATSVTMPQRLKGTVTYMLQDETRQHTNQEKLDFKLHLPCSSYLIPSPLSSHHFTKLLSSGDLGDKATLQLNKPDITLELFLQRLCFYLKFSVVEQIGESASLYSASIQQHHVCLLVKTVNAGISVDGKSDNSSLLSNIMDEVKTVAQP